MDTIRNWKPEQISDTKWKKSIYFPLLKDVKKIKALYKRSRVEFLKRLKSDDYWKKTYGYRKQNLSIQDVKDKYINYFSQFLQHPEIDNIIRQNKLLGGFSMRSSFVSLGVVPDSKGQLYIHDTYKL